jgi:hypothetical protein
MKQRVQAALAIAGIVALVSSSLSGQWPSHPTPGVPRTADGQPNLEAPPPRTADGKPDLSGLWQNALRFGASGGGAGVSGTAGAPREDGTIPARANQFWDISFGMKEPLPSRPWAAALRKQRDDGHGADNPDAHCLPIGLLQFHTHPQPRRMVQTPNLLLIIYESNYGLRQVFLDGRPLPNNDPQPWWYGYSTGRWEGDTLVVETIGLRDGGWLDIIGTPLTDAAKLTERFRRPTYGSLEIDVTVDDPKAYTKPWAVRINQRIMLNNDLIEFICLENEKSTKHFVR